MINVHCYCFGYLGVQRHGASFLGALSRYEELALFPFDAVPTNVPDSYRRMLQNARGPVSADLGIGIGVMNRMPLVTGRRRIAYTVWETTRIPARERAFLDGFDQLWTPSTWGRDNLVDNGFDHDCIRVVAEGVNSGRFKPMPAIGARRTDGRFRFLCVAKWEQRKGIDILLRAFARAFAPSEPVELILHCFNPAVPGFRIETAIASERLPPHAMLTPSYPIADSRMPMLYNLCDAFVLPTRGEGWGLPVIEAMACGLPVIVTDYGACRDFVNDDKAYPLRVAGMLPVSDADHFDPALDFGCWARPDEDHLVALMREVFENRQAAAVKAARARDDVLSRWTWDHAAAVAWRHIEQLRKESSPWTRPFRRG